MGSPYSMGQARTQTGRASKLMSALDKLKMELGSLAEVRSPEDAEEPILARPVANAVYYWLREISLAPKLAEAKVEPRRSCLMSGPPGTGKTMSAHHLASRLGYPMVVVGAETVFASFLGESEQRLAMLFKAMEKSELPCILFMDELDAIGGSRSQNSRGGADNARTSILTVLLRKIEEFKGITIAATNRHADIDPALWRRFHMQITIDLPGFDERYAILTRYLAPFQIAPEALAIIADLTDGASPALLKGLMEGVKRSMIVFPTMNKSLDTPEDVFEPVIASLRPHDENQLPVLWKNKAAIRAIADYWPPTWSTE